MTRCVYVSFLKTKTQDCTALYRVLPIIRFRSRYSPGTKTPQAPSLLPGCRAVEGNAFRIQSADAEILLCFPQILRYRGFPLKSKGKRILCPFRDRMNFDFLLVTISPADPGRNAVRRQTGSVVGSFWKGCRFGASFLYLLFFCLHI